MSVEIIKEKCTARIEQKYGLHNLDPDFAVTLRRIVEKQIEYEIDQIWRHGLGEEFMAMADMTEFVRDSGCMLHPGGWGSSSIVAYLLGITDIDPLSYGLIFNAMAIGKTKMSFSVPSSQRDKLRRELLLLCASRGRVPAYKGGDVLEERDLLIRIADALNLDRYFEDIIEYMETCDLPKPLTDICLENSTIKSFLETKYLGAKIIDMVPYLQGRFGKDMVDFSFKAGSNGIKSRFLEVEDSKILEVAVFGHSELDTLSSALEKLIENDPDFDIDSIPFDNEAAYELIGKADIDGIPYLQCAQGKELCRLIQPKNFDEHVALISFIHSPLAKDLINPYISAKAYPGEIEYAHPEVGMVLGETYGIMLYKEQIVTLIKNLSGIPYETAWEIQEAVMKRGNCENHRKGFINGAFSKSCMEGEAASAILAMFESCPMVSKAFHVQKAILAYRMAYIKNHLTGGLKQM